MNGEAKPFVGGPHLNACRPEGKTAVSYVEYSNIKVREFISRPHNEALLRGITYSGMSTSIAHEIAPITEVA